MDYCLCMEINLPLYKSVYSLSLIIFNGSKNLNKEYKYTIGETLKNNIITMLSYVEIAINSDNKLKYLMVNFDMALGHYYTETNIKKYTAEDIITDHVKIQKTIPSQGYHVWHVEHGQARENQKRVLVYTIYLNTVEEGGETEFLYYPKRVKPKQGTIILFPGALTHAHRGNQSLSNDKYIITGWVEL